MKISQKLLNVLFVRSKTELASHRYWQMKITSVTKKKGRGKKKKRKVCILLNEEASSFFYEKIQLFSVLLLRDTDVDNWTFLWLLFRGMKFLRKWPRQSKKTKRCNNSEGVNYIFNVLTSGIKRYQSYFLRNRLQREREISTFLMGHEVNHFRCNKF